MENTNHMANMNRLEDSINIENSVDQENIEERFTKINNNYLKITKNVKDLKIMNFLDHVDNIQNLKDKGKSSITSINVINNTEIIVDKNDMNFVDNIINIESLKKIDEVNTSINNITQTNILDNSTTQIIDNQVKMGYIQPHQLGDKPNRSVSKRSFTSTIKHKIATHLAIFRSSLKCSQIAHIVIVIVAIIILSTNISYFQQSNEQIDDDASPLIPSDSDYDFMHLSYILFVTGDVVWLIASIAGIILVRGENPKICTHIILILLSISSIIILVVGFVWIQFTLITQISDFDVIKATFTTTIIFNIIQCLANLIFARQLSNISKLQTKIQQKHEKK